MLSLVSKLEKTVLAAIERGLGLTGVPAMLMPTKDDKRGDYQCNAALSLAKRLKMNPRQAAEKLAEAIMLCDSEQTVEGEALIQSCEVAGPGFINLTLKDEGILEAVREITERRLNDRPLKVLVDYSSPNAAKQMHVGHLRSSIIGDSICRILDYLGHEVIRDNHVGDWGTQFGLLCAYIMDHLQRDCREVDLSDLEALYRESQALANEDEAFKEKAHARVVALHNGDKATLDVWRYIIDKSLEHIQAVYKKLGVLLTKEDVVGESFFNPMLPGAVKELQERFPEGSRPMEVKENEGAMCIFMYNDDGTPKFANPEGEPLPFIIRKSDGAFLYATTDLACMRYRVEDLGCDWIIITTDSRQSLHFQMLFASSAAAGWSGKAKVEHIAFGSVLGKDNKPLKTRAGRNVHLSDLLDEAIAMAEETCRRNAENRGFSEAEIKEIAEAVGIGAVKYADLSQNRINDYVFSFEKMLAMEGNTAPYLLYAYARICSIIRRAEEAGLKAAGEIKVKEPAERRLLLQLARFNDIIDQAADGWRINLLCEYLYNLAGFYMKFYECCSVLNAEDGETKLSRLGLCRETAKVLRIGLGLLGIKTVERM
ncbi:arginine--tRNA ligase [bacterium]|nr:arginine--tRNA ligase [bacterium]